MRAKAVSQKDKITLIATALMTLQSLIISNERIRETLTSGEIDTIQEQFEALAQSV